jgi:lipoprotein-anchoring transpeptidase ErfK/SrfK
MHSVRRVLGLCVAAFMALAPVAAQAGVEVDVDLGSQSMDVYVNGQLRHSWNVSTGRSGYDTPSGTYRVKRMEREWYSTLYDDAPMPHAIFFRSGYAIHGTSETKRLGRRASHGCIRLAPANAKRLFNLVSRHGPSGTRISISR